MITRTLSLRGVTWKICDKLLGKIRSGQVNVCLIKLLDLLV